MAERLHKNSDVPDFDTHPLEHPTGLSRSDGDPALEQRARQIGSALGKAVVTLRQAQDAIKDIASETGELAAIRVATMKNKAQEAAGRISNTVKSKTQEWSAAAASQAGHLQQAALEKAAGVRSQVKSGYYRTRLRANQVVREYPLHLVLAAGAAGFLLGAGLRIWRSKREY